MCQYSLLFVKECRGRERKRKGKRTGEGGERRRLAPRAIKEEEGGGRICEGRRRSGEGSLH